MNWTIIIIETIVMTASFTAMILIPLVKNPVWWIHDYPEDIQEEYFKTHERVPSTFISTDHAYLHVYQTVQSYLYAQIRAIRGDDISTEELKS